MQKRKIHSIEGYEENQPTKTKQTENTIITYFKHVSNTNNNNSNLNDRSMNHGNGDKNEDEKEEQVSKTTVNKLNIKTQTLEDGAIIDFAEQFLTPTIAQSLFDHLMTLNYEQSQISVYGSKVNLPRLQSWMADGPETKPSLYQSQKYTPWSSEVLQVKLALEELYDTHFDYVLINYYRNGNDSISYHSDGEAIGEGRNIICGVSVGAPRKFVLRHKEWKSRNIQKLEWMLTSGSLITMIGNATQTHWHHSVPKSKKITRPRFNLTFRHT